MIPHSKPTVGENEIIAVKELLVSGQLAQGQHKALFVQKLKDALKVNNVFLAGSGTAAQILLLKALGVQAGQEVILPSYVCKSVFEAVVAVGASPVLCDIGDSWIMTYEAIKAKVTGKTSAIILVHIFGIDAWDDRLASLNIPVVEDFCQSFGLRINESAMLKGVAGFYSFHATKCFTTGEGGAIAVNDDKLVSKLIDWSGKEFINRFSDYQSALGIAQLDQYTGFLKKRADIAAYYFSELPSAFTKKLREKETNSVWFRFPLLMKDSLKFMQFMADKGITVRKGVDEMLHKRYDIAGSFAETERVFSETICLPIYPSLSVEEEKYIVNSVNEYYKLNYE